MNTKKLDALRKEYRDKVAERKKMSASIESLRAAATKAKDRMQDAAAGGDVEEYLRLKGEADRADAALFVTETRLKAPVLLDRNAVNAAWEEYEKAHAPQMTAALAKLRQATQELVKAFDAAVYEQDAALAIRKECADLCGAGQDKFSLSNAMTVGVNEMAYRGFIEFILEAKGVDNMALDAVGPRDYYRRVIKSKVAKMK